MLKIKKNVKREKLRLKKRKNNIKIWSLYI